ncbi:P-loop containing nucleoside triphosphate hydrolase protein [Phlebopus sp. FC_14]|nr:P-loop containing nucleoside triphosphate hydrolase protein [Phlebopus sp. FC_14]
MKSASALSAEQKHFAAIAHTERADKRAAALRQASKSPASTLGNEFDLSSSSSPGTLANRFSSPPLLPGLLQSVKEILGEEAEPSAIQALSLEHLFERDRDARWKQCLLASETGSGKSIAYLLPLLQDLKRTELEGSQSFSSPRKNLSKPLNPRALVFAPTHELSRQLAGFAKNLSHIIKLRVMCASRANTRTRAKVTGTASKMKENLIDMINGDESGEFVISRGNQSSRPVDLLVGTPMKLLELERGRGWNWEQRARERALRINTENPAKADGISDTREPRKFWVDEPEMGLENVEWVVVDEADVLFDPDFEESTRQLLSDIAAARGQPVAVIPASALSSSQTPAPTPDSPHPISYPFNFLLTSATIPSSLSNYLSTYHPTLTRLASPNLHHLPSTLRTEHAKWTGGNKDADIERRIRRVWAEDALAHAKSVHAGLGPAKLSKIIIFCNKRTKVEELAAFLEGRGIKNVALTGGADSRKRGSNHHLDGFLKPSATSAEPNTTVKTGSSDPAVIPHVLLTTSLLSRGLDFSPEIKHVFIVDEPRNMIDFLHRAGRAGRAGEAGKVVVFGRASGRGSGRTADMRKRVRALTA